jgi:hypothetical protein
MDPHTTWQVLCATVHALSAHPDDPTLRAEAIELLQTLAHWLRRGGFPPTSARHEPAKEELCQPIPLP